MQGSFLPPLPGSDFGTWRRILIIPIQVGSTVPAPAGAGADPSQHGRLCQQRRPWRQLVDERVVEPTVQARSLMINVE